MISAFRRWVTLCAAVSACAGFAACAIDESGTSDAASPDANIVDAPIDQTVDAPPDVSTDVTSDLNTNDSSDGGFDADAADVTDASDAADVITTCEIDASCVSAIPQDAGWALLGISTDGGACALVQGSLLADAQAAPSACTCGCTTSGTPTCGAANFAAWTDPSCSTLAVDGSVTSGCVDVGDLVPDSGVAVVPPTVTGVTCDASVTGNQSIVSQQFETCAATKCTDDYCGMKATGFRLCIAHDPPVSSCPTGFPVRIDAVASASVSCTGCTCGVKTPQCTGTVTTYDASACGGGSITSFSAAACTALTDETLSISYAPDQPPTVTCSAGSLGSTVNTLGSAVLCCVP